MVYIHNYMKHNFEVNESDPGYAQKDLEQGSGLPPNCIQDHLTVQPGINKNDCENDPTASQSEQGICNPIVMPGNLAGEEVECDR
jgi:hypothetical protein